MVAAQGGYLGQMGDGDNLAVLTAHLLHHLGHLLGNLAAHARVYLVEDDGRQFHGSADHCLQRQHHASNLTARGHLSDRLEWGRGVGREEEAHLVVTHPRQLALLYLHGKAHLGHA